MIVKLLKTRDWGVPAEARCSMCRELFHVGEVEPVLVSDSKIEIGPVCWKCCQEGPERMAERLETETERAYEVWRECERISSERVHYVPNFEELMLAENLYAGE